MIYKFRLKLSELFFRWGKAVHPDIAALKKKIKEQSEQLSMFKLSVEDE